MPRVVRHPLRSTVALWQVVRAAARVWWLEPRCDLNELVAGLRRAPRAHYAIDLTFVRGVVERLMPFLPPRGAGRCVKRSLVLLDVWTRAGLAPRLHLGVASRDGARQGHVWVSGGDEPTLDGFHETWSA